VRVNALLRLPLVAAAVVAMVVVAVADVYVNNQPAAALPTYTVGYNVNAASNVGQGIHYYVGYGLKILWPQGGITTITNTRTVTTTETQTETTTATQVLTTTTVVTTTITTTISGTPTTTIITTTKTISLAPTETTVPATIDYGRLVAAGAGLAFVLLLIIATLVRR